MTCHIIFSKVLSFSNSLESADCIQPISPSLWPKASDMVLAIICTFLSMQNGKLDTSDPFLCNIPRHRGRSKTLTAWGCCAQCLMFNRLKLCSLHDSVWDTSILVFLRSRRFWSYYDLRSSELPCPDKTSAPIRCCSNDPNISNLQPSIVHCLSSSSGA